MLRPSGRDFDYQAALARLERDANSGIMFELPAEELDKYSPKARIIAAIVTCLILFFVVLIVRDQLRRHTSVAGVYRGFLPWLMLLPALGSIAVWRYYPLTRGLVMAFQDYNVRGFSEWVGMTNFADVIYDAEFWYAVWVTLKYAVLFGLLGFTSPILLAFLLSEVPKGKVLFRIIYYLPMVLSGVIFIYLWKLEEELKRVVTAFRERRPIVSGEEARKRVLVCIEAERSLKEGREIELRF